MAHELRAEIDIKAPPHIVWEILTDLDQFSEWNPFIVSSSGTVAVGEKLANRLQPPGGRAMTFRPIVTVADEGRAFEWLGRLGLRGIFDGRHRFELEETAEGTHLIHSEHFTGILVPFMRRSLDSQTLRGFDKMNAALKARAEARVQPDGSS